MGLRGEVVQPLARVEWGEHNPVPLGELETAVYGEMAEAVISLVMEEAAAWIRANMPVSEVEGDDFADALMSTVSPVPASK